LETRKQLYLIPTVLSEAATYSIPEYVKDQVKPLRFFVVEQARTARRYLRKIGFTADFDKEVKFLDLSENNSSSQIKSFLRSLPEGGAVGLISEAGCPSIADPGAEIVKIAHASDFEVVPMIGPSSILLALISSGMNGQGFTFHGYLPIEKSEKIKKIKELESMALKSGYTQIFMETPYRNNALIKDIIDHCKEDMIFSIAADLTGQKQFIKSQRIAHWKKETPDLHKIPAVYCMNF
jgi:16S rRNA (cytidine1402-2'-O)-methyltransferase